MNCMHKASLGYLLQSRFLGQQSRIQRFFGHFHQLSEHIHSLELTQMQCIHSAENWHQQLWNQIKKELVV